ncbi:MAG: GNVR domain-containing protein [Balneola sp.]
MNNSFSLLDIISVLLKWKAFLITQIILLCVFSVLLALSLPKTYTSSATILPPGQSNLLNSILPQSLTRGLAGALGGGAFDQDGETTKVLAVLNSRTFREKILSEFDLIERFESPTIEDALESLSKVVSTSSDDNGIINISVSLKTDFFHPDENEIEIRQLVKNIAEFLVKELDTSYTRLGTQKARYELQEIEKRYNQNIEDIKKIENEIRSFSEETGILSLPDQVEALIKVTSELESQIIIEELKLNLLEFGTSESNSQVVQQRKYIRGLKDELENLRINNSESKSVLPALNKTPEYSLTYFRLKREFEVQNYIYEFLTQQYEQLKLKEAKDSPSLQFIDLPQIPTKRSAPTRSIIVVLIIGSGTFITILSVLIISLYREKMSYIIKQLRNNTN